MGQNISLPFHDDIQLRKKFQKNFHNFILITNITICLMYSSCCFDIAVFSIQKTKKKKPISLNAIDKFAIRTKKERKEKKNLRLK